MFRFPYTQTYHQKNVTELAPDFLVFINGELTVPICRDCGRRGNINDDITNVSVSLSVHPGSGTASFDLATPRHGINVYVKNGEPVFGPMSEVEIFMKGRFISCTNPEPKYYQVFWGLVSSFSESYNDGVHTISVDCRDILRWWDLMVINVHPAALAQQYFAREQPGVGKPAKFFNHNPYSIIYALAQTMGSLQYPQGLNLGTSFNQKRPEASLDKDFNTPEDTRASTEVTKERTADLMVYWQKRFNQIGKALRMFGLDGVLINGKDDIALRNSELSDQRAFQGTLPFDVDRANISDYVSKVTPYPNFQASIGAVESEYRTKLAIAKEVTEFIDYEFYMDFTGEIIFKPPFYNLDVRPNPILNIQDQDIIGWTITEDESQVYTRCDVYGNLFPAGEFEPAVKPLGWAVDQKLARQYGIRQKVLQVNWLNDARACHLYALGWLDRTNAMRVNGTITIPGRPELRLGYPIYVAPRDAYYYVESISHSLSVGSTFTTTIKVQGVRRKFTPPHIAQPYTASKEGLAELRNSLEFKNGTPNVILSSSSDSARQKRAIFKKDPISGQVTDALIETVPTHAIERSTASFDITEFGSSFGTYVYEVKSGEYFTRIIQTKDFQRVEVKSKNFGFSTYQFQPSFSYSTVIPITDEDGYDLIGMFPYGRNMRIDIRGNVSFKSVSSLSQKVSNTQQTKLIGSISALELALRATGNAAFLIAGMAASSFTQEAILNYQIDHEKLAINQLKKEFIARFVKEIKTGKFDRDNACQCWQTDADYVNALGAKLTMYGG